MSKEHRDLYLRLSVQSHPSDSFPEISLSVWTIDSEGYAVTPDNYIGEIIGTTGPNDRHYQHLKMRAYFPVNGNGRWNSVWPYYDLNHIDPFHTGQWERFDRMAKTLKRVREAMSNALLDSPGATFEVEAELFADALGIKGFVELGQGSAHTLLSRAIGFAKMREAMRKIENERGIKAA